MVRSPCWHGSPARRDRADSRVMRVVVAEDVMLTREGIIRLLADAGVEVLGLVVEGLSNIAIAQRLFITERTVEAHVKQIFQKLRIDQAPETNRRVLAVLAYLRSGSA